MQTPKFQKLTSSDFVYVYEPGIGQTYQNCAYTIAPLQHGYSNSYRVFYQGQLLTGTDTYLAAVEVCARHDAKRAASIDEVK
jgi:hypothetical protein